MNRETALALLEWANEKNPGPWREHSLGVARAAEAIARECGMDPEKAYIMGLMHDIGRYEGVTAIRHIFAGYELMLEKGEPDIARICLTHSFPYAEAELFLGDRDVSAEALAMLDDILKTPMDDWDKLIQLCDALAMGSGVCLMEKRMIDVIRRHGCIPLTPQKIRSTMEIFEYFQNKMGKNLYSLFPEAVENTFGK